MLKHFCEVRACYLDRMFLYPRKTNRGSLARHFGALVMSERDCLTLVSIPLFERKEEMVDRIEYSVANTKSCYSDWNRL